MSKRELIDCITRINPTAKPEFLAQFDEQELADYLDHLIEAGAEPVAVATLQRD